MLQASPRVNNIVIKDGTTHGRRKEGNSAKSSSSDDVADVETHLLSFFPLLVRRWKDGRDAVTHAATGKR
jgi:hypothetical protein